MNPTAEDIHHRLDQLRLIASETNDPLAERLVLDLIVELEDMPRAHGALAVFLFLSSCRQQPTDSNRTSASNDQLPLELARSILYLAMGAGCGTRLSSHRYRAKLKRQYPLAATCFLPSPS